MTSKIQLLRLMKPESISRLSEGFFLDVTPDEIRTLSLEQRQAITPKQQEEIRPMTYWEAAQRLLDYRLGKQKRNPVMRIKPFKHQESFFALARVF